LRSADRISIDMRESKDGWIAHVTVRDGSNTTHHVRVSRAELTRYGGGDVADLMRRSFEFLIAREPNTSILREFDLSAIERFFPEYPREIRPR
jgi:hypothetical protein